MVRLSHRAERAARTRGECYRYRLWPNGVNINAEVGATDVRALQGECWLKKRISVLPSTATAIADYG